MYNSTTHPTPLHHINIQLIDLSASMVKAFVKPTLEMTRAQLLEIIALEMAALRIFDEYHHDYIDEKWQGIWGRSGPYLRSRYR